MSTLSIAILSSLLTVLLIGALYRFVLLPRLEQRLRRWATELEDRVRRATEEGAAAALPSLREAVSDAMTRAGGELLPELRRQVQESLTDAMAGAVSGDLLDTAAKKVARRGSSLVETGLNMLLRPRAREKPDRNGDEGEEND